MNIEEFLQIAEDEYKLNGRSERFVSMENEVLWSRNSKLIIKFSELEGARIKNIAMGVRLDELRKNITLGL
jgi:hypothetical protein